VQFTGCVAPNLQPEEPMSHDKKKLRTLDSADLASVNGGIMDSLVDWGVYVVAPTAIVVGGGMVISAIKSKLFGPKR
jgi:hypothetical protein